MEIFIIYHAVLSDNFAWLNFNYQKKTQNVTYAANFKL